MNTDAHGRAAGTRERGNGIVLSLAMIVRDGGQDLDRLLGEAAPHVDEIVVGDTGSRDDSPAVVLRHGGRVVDVPWRDDFSAARNAVLAACRGAWRLILDADERLDPRGWAEVRSWVEARRRDGRRQAACIVTRNYVRRPYERRGWLPVPSPDPYTLPPAPPAAGYVPTAKVRLVPDQPGIAFRGRLHETLEASLHDADVAVVHLPLPVHHLGSLRPDAGKIARYLALAERKAAEHPHDPAAWSELADCAVAKGDLRLGLVAINRSLVLEPGAADRRLTAGWLLKELGRHAEAELQLRAVAAAADRDDAQLAECCHLRAQIAVLDGRSADAAPLLALAVRLAPDNGHYLNTVGVWHLTCGRGDAARRALERARDLLPDLADPDFNLGRLYEAAGHQELAARHFVLALQRDPGHAQAAAAVARLGAGAGV